MLDSKTTSLSVFISRYSPASLFLTVAFERELIWKCFPIVFPSMSSFRIVSAALRPSMHQSRGMNMHG